MKEEIVFKPKQESILVANTSLPLGLVFIALGIDLWFSKTLIVTDYEFYVKCWGIKFKLNKETSFMRIDSAWVPSTISTSTPTLNIYRNPANRWKRLFKNKIKLYYVENQSKPKKKNKT